MKLLKSVVSLVLMMAGGVGMGYAQGPSTAAIPCDENLGVRQAALGALLKTNAEGVVEILASVLQNRNECSLELRRLAPSIIAQSMIDESVEVLLDLARRDPDSEVREQAVFWLHYIDTPEALGALQAVIAESPDEELQKHAIFTISQRSDAAGALEILGSYAERSDLPRELRKSAIFWISQSPETGGAEYLIQLYGRLEDDELREQAIWGIAHVASENSRAWLVDRVMNTDEAMDVRKYALFWLGGQGQDGMDVVDLQNLYTAVEEPELKEHVMFVASHRSDALGVDFLMDIVRNETDSELRGRAIFWLGDAGDPRVAEFLLTLITN